MPKKPNTLLVLGAGASIGAKRYPIESSSREVFVRMPSSRNFFYDLFRYNSKPGQPRRDLNMLGMMYEGTNWLINQAWGMTKHEIGYDPEEWRGVNVEDVFSFVDIGSRLYSRGSTYQRGFKLSRESLIDFIVMMLMTRAEGQHCELLMRLLTGLKSTDSIISFNYDTIADFTLQYVKNPQYRTYANLMSGKLPRVRDYENKGLLLKLHGSVNWRYCLNRKCRYYKLPHIPFASNDRKLPQIYHGDFNKCKGCGHDRPEPAIIPPMTEKNVDKHDFFYRLWQIARAQVSRFDRIIFIGYSFPVNDPYTEWLFRQLRFAQRKPAQIIVVNPEAMRPRHPVAQRYAALFRGFPIEYHADFEEFVNGPWFSKYR